MDLPLDLLISAVAFTVQAAIDLDDSSDASSGAGYYKRVADLRALENSLLTKLSDASFQMLARSTHDLSSAMGHLIDMARKLD